MTDPVVPQPAPVDPAPPIPAEPILPYPPDPKTPHKKWLVLVGGGACGRWQAGALENLYKSGVLNNLVGIVGTSVGGLNAVALAAGLAQGKGTDVLKMTWSMISKDENVYTPSITAITANPLLHIPEELGGATGVILGCGFCSTDPLKSLVDGVLGSMTTDEVKAKTGIDVYVRAYDNSKGQDVTLQGRLVDMGLATSAIEVLFPAYKGFSDGGISNNSPINIALNTQADQIVVVYCGPEDPGQSYAPQTIDQNTPDPNTKALSVALGYLSHITQANEALVDSIATAAEQNGIEVIYCYPTKDTGSSLDFSSVELYARGLAESGQAVVVAQTMGWIS